MDHSSHSSMSSMSSSASTKPSCKISMLWNWYTVDSCFIARGWHNYTRAQFAGSCIGVFLIVVALEFIRRSQREYDRYIIREWRSQQQQHGNEDAAAVGKKKTEVQVRNSWISPLNMRPSLGQQVIRSGFYMVQFGLAYLVMLLAMYYNGYIIIMILLGAFAGHFLFGYDAILIGGKQETGTSCC